MKGRKVKKREGKYGEGGGEDESLWKRFIGVVSDEN